MSDLASNIQSDSIEALKAGNQVKRVALGMLITAIKNKEIENKTAGGDNNLNDEDVLLVIFSEAKKRRDSIKAYEDGGREDLALKEKEELKILEEYLPEQMGEDDIRKIVKEVISEVGASSMQDIGKVMGPIMGRLKSQADGGVVNKIVKEELSA